MEYLINQVAADIGVGDVGARGGGSEPPSLSQMFQSNRKGAENGQKMGRDLDLTNIGCGLLSEERGADTPVAADHCHPRHLY